VFEQFSLARKRTHWLASLNTEKKRKNDNKPNTWRWTAGPLAPTSANRCPQILLTDARDGSTAKTEFQKPHGQTQFSSTAYPGVYGTSDGSPKWPGPLPPLARPNSRCVAHENQNTSVQPPVAQLTKKPRAAEAHTFHRYSPANYQSGNHIRTRGGGWVFDVRKSALRLDFEPAWGERLTGSQETSTGCRSLGASFDLYLAPAPSLPSDLHNVFTFFKTGW
jgi:hypothetical protein